MPVLGSMWASGVVTLIPQVVRAQKPSRAMWAMSMGHW